MNTAPKFLLSAAFLPELGAELPLGAGLLLDPDDAEALAEVEGEEDPDDEALELPLPPLT